MGGTVRPSRRTPKGRTIPDSTAITSLSIVSKVGVRYGVVDGPKTQKSKVQVPVIGPGVKRRAPTEPAADPGDRAFVDEVDLPKVSFCTEISMTKFLHGPIRSDKKLP